MAQLDPRLMAFLAPQIRAPRIYGMQGPAEMPALTPLELGAPARQAPRAAQPAPQPASPASQAGQPRPGAPARRSPWRVLDGVLGGRTISESMDYEDARMEAGRAKERQAAELAARTEAFRASVDDEGNFDPRAYLQAHDRLGLPLDIADIKSILETGRPIFANDVTVGGIRFRPGEDGSYTEVARDSRPDWQMGPDRNGDGEGDWYNANPAPSPRPGTPGPAPQGAEPPPPPGFVIARPTEAPATVGAAPQGFSNRDELLGFVRQAIPGARPTSGYRTQAEQDALVRRGVTRAKRSSHTYSGGQDIVPPGDPSTWGPYVEQLRASGRFRKVIVETGRGRNQGTAPHIHLEPY